MTSLKVLEDKINRVADWAQRVTTSVDDLHATMGLGPIVARDPFAILAEAKRRLRDVPALPGAWYTNDPRHVIGKYGSILVVATGAEPFAFSAEVYTKESYYVATDHPSIAMKYVSENAAWPTGWIWCFYPTLGLATENEG